MTFLHRILDLRLDPVYGEEMSSVFPGRSKGVWVSLLRPG